MRIRRSTSGKVEDGETLVEVLAALTILGLTLFTLVSGIASVIALGNLRQKEAAVGGVVRTLSESMNAIGSTICSKANADTLRGLLTAFNSSSWSQNSGVSVLVDNSGSPSLTVLQGQFGGGVLSFPSGNDCTSTSASGTDSGTLQLDFTVIASGVNAQGAAVNKVYSQNVTLVLGSPRA